MWSHGKWVNINFSEKRICWRGTKSACYYSQCRVLNSLNSLLVCSSFVSENKRIIFQYWPNQTFVQQKKCFTISSPLCGGESTENVQAFLTPRLDLFGMSIVGKPWVKCYTQGRMTIVFWNRFIINHKGGTKTSHGTIRPSENHGRRFGSGYFETPNLSSAPCSLHYCAHCSLSILFL